MLGAYTPIRVDHTHKPQLVVIVDTEEEFDWDADISRNATAVTAMQHIHRIQDLLDEYGITPCYVIDYPIAAQAEGRAPLQAFLREQRCEIGVQLHPWVTPPHSESINNHNSYPGNLPRDLERAKMRVMRDIVQEHFGFAPHIYKAGRYGLGPHTVELMEELGFDIDLSVCSGFDYRDDGGPDFSTMTPQPCWFGQKQQLLEIPVSGCLVGWSGPLARHTYRIASHLESFKATAILSRMGAVDRLMLSPEGYTFDEHVKLTHHLLNQGIRTFTWNVHSPSVAPGFTPYVQNGQDLQNFLDAFRRYFDFFFGTLGGEASSPTRLRDQLAAQRR